MRASLPKLIRVGPYRIKIRGDPKLNKKNREAEYDPSASEIHYWPGLSAERLRTTLFHELVHVAFDIGDLLHGKDISEESLIERLTPILVAMLRDNPDLVRFICSGA